MESKRNPSSTLDWSNHIRVGALHPRHAILAWVQSTHLLRLATGPGRYCTWASESPGWRTPTADQEVWQAGWVFPIPDSGENR